MQENSHRGRGKNQFVQWLRRLYNQYWNANHIIFAEWWGLLYHTEAWVCGLAHGLMVFTPIRRKYAKKVDIGKYICTN